MARLGKLSEFAFTVFGEQRHVCVVLSSGQVCQQCNHQQVVLFVGAFIYLVRAFYPSNMNMDIIMYLMPMK